MNRLAAAMRRAWRAASSPARFFATLPDLPAIRPAAATAAASAAVAALAAGVLVARATGSDAWVPILLAAPALVLPYLAIVTLLGGLTLMRPAGLDLRAFEVAAWAWTPAGFLAISLLPIGLLAPGPALVGGLAMLPPWHLWLVWRGTHAHATHRARAAFLLYVAAVFGLPSALTAFTLAVFANLA